MKRIMLNWLKNRKKTPLKTTSNEVVVPTREEVVAEALKNMQETRDKIGQEKLQKLANIILHKKTEADDISPSVQVKKIMAHMDKEKLGQFMKLMVEDNQTKH
jgi:hypothetical protein